MRERVEAVSGVGSTERVDVVEHLAPGAERSFRDEVGLDPSHALGHADAVEDLEGQDEFGGRTRTLGKHADAEGGVEEAEAGEALPLRAHFTLERLEEGERRKPQRHRHPRVDDNPTQKAEKGISETGGGPVSPSPPRPSGPPPSLVTSPWRADPWTSTVPSRAYGAPCRPGRPRW